jgi:sphinganine-1-phosphate aldolase
VHEDRKTFRADVRAMARAIDGNTICIVGSCPQYPYGCVDPIVELGRLASSRGIGLHVDCCLGSFMVPFMREAGEKDFPDFDFRVPGVTSISADTHKFGYTPKGSSVIMYSSNNLRKYQFSVFPDWPGGIYGTPNMAGSRPGALIAATWAAMLFHGHNRYIENAKIIRSSVHALAQGIKGIKGLKLCCEPDVMVVAFTSDAFDINHLIQPMEELGWDLGVLQFPSAIHIGVTMAHTKEAIAKLLSDLETSVAPLCASPKKRVEGVGAMYGMAQSLPDRSIVDELVRATLGVSYKVEAKAKAQ